MPTERKFKIFFAFFCYGGNGGIASINPGVLEWWGQLTPQLCADPRIGPDGYVKAIISDTPITMTRNKAVQTAQDWGADILVMIDSDNIPDIHLDQDKNAKRFFPTSFDFLVENWAAGPNVVFAPYCGPPPHPVKGGEENVYVFQWVNHESDGGKDASFALSGYSREQAVMMKGIHPAGAGPTGVIMYDMRAFELIKQPYFAYEFNSAQSEKQSTEDVYNTRNISLCGWATLGRDCMYCNWDSWAGHAKTKVVGAPRQLFTEQVADTYREAVLNPVSILQRLENLNLKPLIKQRTPVPIQPAQPKPDAMIPGITQIGQPVSEGVAKDLLAQGDAGVTMSDLDRRRLGELVIEAGEAAKARSGIVRIIEVGTWIGSTAKFMAELLDKLDVGYRIDVVDTFEGSETDHTRQVAEAAGGSMFRRFRENVGHYFGTKIIAHTGTSQEVAMRYADRADLIFLDADHSYEAVLSDILAWAPKLRLNGTICGHDFQQPGFEGVEQAVLEVFPEVMVHGTVWSICPEKAAPKFTLPAFNGTVIDCSTDNSDLEEFIPTGV